MSRVLPCSVKKVLSCAITVENVKQLNHMGKRLKRSFTSSTWVTEHSLQWFLFLVEA